MSSSLGRDVAGVVGLYAASVASIVVFWEYSLLLALVFACIAYAAHRLGPRSQNAALFVAGAVLGSTAEAVAVATGVWTYAQPKVAGLPPVAARRLGHGLSSRRCRSPKQPSDCSPPINRTIPLATLLRA